MTNSINQNTSSIIYIAKRLNAKISPDLNQT